MIDIMKYAQPKEKLDLEDGIEILSDANCALDAIGKKLEIMKKLASHAADPKCDPVKRMAMNLLFNKLRLEIDSWAQTSSCGIRLLIGPNAERQTPFKNNGS